MLFTWDTTDLCVVFSWWHVRGPWSLVFSLLGIVGLGISYELLRKLARKYDHYCFERVRLGSPTPDDVDGRRSPNSNPTKWIVIWDLNNCKIWEKEAYYKICLIWIASILCLLFDACCYDLSGRSHGDEQLIALGICTYCHWDWSRIGVLSVSRR